MGSSDDEKRKKQRAEDESHGKLLVSKDRPVEVKVKTLQLYVLFLFDIRLSSNRWQKTTVVVVTALSN